jgi:DNA-directed RNA polymerase subunit RPC12/RpoP
VVNCPDCGKSNPAGSVYCNSCGKKLPLPGFEVTVKCPYCGAPGQEYLFNCSKCGKELPRDASGKPLRSESGEGKRFCRNCGKELGAYYTSCPSCGKPVSDAGISSVYDTSRYGDEYGDDYAIHVRPSSGMPTAAGVCLVLAGVLALGQGAIYALANSIAVSPYGYGGSLCLCGGLDIIFGLGSIGGAIMCFGRSSFILALIGAVLGLLGLGFLIGSLFGLIGLILVAVSKDEFEG